MLASNNRYRLVHVPGGSFPWHVVAPDGLPEIRLTKFVCELETELSKGSIPVYLREVLCLFDWASADSVIQQKGWQLFGTPDEVRSVIRQYLTVGAYCKVNARPDSFGQVLRYVKKTGHTRIHPGILLAALKKLYGFLGRVGLYGFANPLIQYGFDDIRRCLKRQREAAFRELQGRGPMPRDSGVDPPSGRFRLSENYFRFVDHGWRPRCVEDPNFPAVIIAAGKAAGWQLREICLTRMLFESGARISEICALTLGDWASSQFLNSFRAQNKGSHGLRIKGIFVSSPTVKILRRYVDEPHHGRAACDRRALDMAAIERLGVQTNIEGRALLDASPLFLGSNGLAFTPENFRQHYWKPALKAAGIDADPHQARHWFVTNAMRTIYRNCTTAAEIEQEKRRLIAYMAWRAGERTLQVYEHWLSAQSFTESLETIHQQMWSQECQISKGTDQGATPGTQPPRTVDDFGTLDDDLAFLLGEDV